jgi:hypothetical protein
MEKKHPVSTNQPVGGDDASRARKRPYAAPRLIEYGSVAKLTRGGGSLQADGGSTFKRTKGMCL